MLMVKNGSAEVHHLYIQAPHLPLVEFLTHTNIFTSGFISAFEGNYGEAFTIWSLYTMS